MISKTVLTYILGTIGLGGPPSCGPLGAPSLTDDGRGLLVLAGGPRGLIRGPLGLTRGSLGLPSGPLGLFSGSLWLTGGPPDWARGPRCMGWVVPSPPPFLSTPLSSITTD